MNRRFNISFIALLCCWTLALAQDDGLDKEVVIEKAYKAIIQEADRLEMAPDYQDTSRINPKPNYDIRSFETTLDYAPRPIKPLALKDEKLAKYKNSYIKLGFGHPIMPLADLVYRDETGEHISYGAHYRHLSAKGSAENQRFSDDDLGANMRWQKKNLGTEIRFDYERDVDHYYGYIGLDTSFKKDAVRQRQNQYQGRVKFGSAGFGKKGSRIQQTAYYSHYNEISAIKENHYSGTTSFEQRIKEVHQIGIQFQFDLLRLKRNIGLIRNIYQTNLSYTFDNNDWLLKASMGLVFENDDFYVFPDISTEKKLFEDKLIFYTRWHRYLRINTLENMMERNPWMRPDSKIQNAREEDRIAGFKGSYKRLDYQLEFRNKLVKQMPLFVNDTVDMKRFTTIYDKSMNLFDLHTSVNYSFPFGLALGLRNDLYIYEVDRVAEAWHLPTLDFGFSASYDWDQKILIGFELYGLRGAMARRQNGTAVQIDGVADINLEVEYRFSDYLHFFVDLNNLANTNYETYLNYPSFGIQAIGGIRFSY